MDPEKIKSNILEQVEKNREELWDLSLKIHDNPELGFHESRAMGWLTEFLGKKDFEVQRGFAELPTAFKATYGAGRPAIAFLAEYDALPEMGHACGHNLICAAAAGAAIASKIVVDRYGGQVMVIGTPAEELYGGKVLMVQKDAFSGVDVAMMMHPGNNDLAVTAALACQGLDVEFTGRPSHAAADPEAGINALEAMIQSYNAINSLRQHIRPSARIHGIITDGGQAANVVPAHSAAKFIVRAKDMQYLAELKLKVLDCFQGAALATGAFLKYKWDDQCYAPVLNNLTLSGLFVKNMNKLGRTFSLKYPDKSCGSTDFGNVSQVVPGMHVWVSIADAGVLAHSSQFAEAAASDRSQKSMLDAAKGLAMVLADLLSDPLHLAKVRDEFNKQKHIEPA
jgi:amidohydrolase